MRKARLARAQEAEFKLLQHPPVPFDGRVWACAKWASGCIDRIIEMPPYDDVPSSERCGTHGLLMTTKTAECRTASSSVVSLEHKDRLV